MTLTIRTKAVLVGPADAVFDAVTDLSRLPDWNDRMTAIVETPPALEPGAEWVVEFRVMGRRWRSRSTLVELDRNARRFVHHSRTDDGNPSWTEWRWTVTEHPAGAEVTVSCELHPVTFWRRVLLARVRQRQLARTELTGSLAALDRHVTAPHR